jgi:outer membrane protein TolC
MQLYKYFAAPTVLATVMLASLPAQSQQQDEQAQAVTLDEVLDQVAQNNEEWEITEARIEQARGVRRQARAALLPSLTLQASGTRHGQNIEVAGQQVRPRYDWSASGRASIAVFDGQAYPLLARSGELLEATEALATWRRRSVLFEATQAFYLLAASQERVAIAERSVELRQAQYERAQALLDAQIAVRLDVERARAQLLEAQQELLVAQASLGDADDALAALLAMEPEEVLRAEVDEEAFDEPPERAPIDELDRRVDFQAVEHQIRAIELEERAVWWGFLPRIDLNLDGQAGPESAFSRPDGYAWSLSLSATWLLYDGGARYGRIDQLQAQTREEELSYTRELRQARVGVRQALRGWRTAVTSIDVARQQVEAARQAYESAQARFEQGLDTNIEVIEASESLFRAETSLNQRIFEARTAEAEYRYLVGLLGGE